MKPLNLKDVEQYVEDNIGTFHQKRLDKIQELQLGVVLKRKNPYLFRAKHILTSEALVRSILDAYLSSQEETLFGDFLETVAIFVGEQVFGGYKPEQSELIGIDLVFASEDKLYIVEIKSGPNWGNSSQINKMIQNFAEATTQLQSQYPNHIIVPVNGCSYGKDASPNKRNGTYWKLCGQDFWQFLSGSETLYAEIIEPLGYRAKQRNEDFDRAYAKIINRFTLEFGKNYCDSDGAINWAKLIKFVSERKSKLDYPFLQNFS